MNEFVKKIASSIDQTLLRPNTTQYEIEKLCSDALDFGFASVCVLPYYVLTANKFLTGSDIKVSTVIGFPFGGTFSSAKLAEAEKALECGAQELDMVINIAALMSGDIRTVREDIEAMSELTRLNDAKLKVIIETCLLNELQKVEMCGIVSDSGADYIKTSTGFSRMGATVADIELLRKNCPLSVKIKASGGINTAAFALELIEAGADRIGTSSGLEIIKELMEI